MSKNRTWITREEIAQIHLARARNMIFRKPLPDDTTGKLAACMDTATQIRATERLSRPVGDRVA